MSSMHQIPPLGHLVEPWLLVDEISHRVANEYAAAVASISLAARRCADAGAKIALADAAERLLDHAAAHRALRPPLARGLSELGLYLRGLCGAIVRAKLAERNITLTLIEEPIELDAERCWRVGLIVSELIANAARHGLRGRAGGIVVELATCNGAVECRVADDGSSVDPKPGRGARIAGALALELGGRIDWEFGPRGTTARLCFPQDRRASPAPA
jgi:two-component sensor histidine kinase